MSKEEDYKKKLALVVEHMKTHPDANKKAVCMSFQMGATTLERMIKEGHLKFKPRSPRDNWKGY